MSLYQLAAVALIISLTTRDNAGEGLSPIFKEEVVFFLIKDNICDVTISVISIIGELEEIIHLRHRIDKLHF